MKSLVKLTKVQLIREVNNDMCHNWYFICYGRIYTEDLTKFMRVKYIVWFDIYDVCERLGYNIDVYCGDLVLLMHGISTNRTLKSL